MLKFVIIVIAELMISLKISFFMIPKKEYPFCILMAADTRNRSYAIEDIDFYEKNRIIQTGCISALNERLIAQAFLDSIKKVISERFAAPNAKAKMRARIPLLSFIVIRSY